MRVYAQFYEFNEKLIINLKYGRIKFEKIADDFDFVKSAMQGKDVLNDGNDAALKKYLSQIGESDAQSQLEYLNEQKAELGKLKRESEENFKKYGSLYFKLSVMAGLLIAVLLA